MVRPHLRAAAILVVMLLPVGGLIWLAVRPDACHRDANHTYPRLVVLAQQTLRGVPHTDLETSDQCTDTGSAYAAVGSRIHSWATRDQAAAYLTARRWAPMELHGVTWLSPGGRYTAVYGYADAERHYLGIWFQVRGQPFAG